MCQRQQHSSARGPFLRLQSTLLQPLLPPSHGIMGPLYLIANTWCLQGGLFRVYRQAATPSFTIWLHPSEAKEQDFEFSQPQASLIWHKSPKSCVSVPLGSLKGPQAAKEPSNFSSSFEQSPEHSATPHPHLHQ